MYLSLLFLFAISAGTVENTSQYYKLTNCSETDQKVPLNLIGLFPFSTAVASNAAKHCDILSYGAVQLLSTQLPIYYPDLFSCFDVKLHSFTSSLDLHVNKIFAVAFNGH